MARRRIAAYIANGGKIVKVGSTFLAGSGSATCKIIMRDDISRPRVTPKFDEPMAIFFRPWQRLHAVLEQEDFLLTGSDKDDALEPTRFDVLPVNPRGIFGIGAHRTVQEHSKFYAIGSAVRTSPSAHSTPPTTIRAVTPWPWRNLLL
jgi:ATP-dependent HslUV protease, peptidase subunit HslV